MKYYLKNVRETRQNIKNLAISIAQSPNDKENTNAAIAAIQEQMIQLGQELEQRFRLQNSRILRLLETGCELCYQTVAEKIDVHSFCNYIDMLLRDMEHEYVWSTPEDAYELSAVAIIKNEDYIIEWIEYHLMVGVQHFYIYDNESTNGLEKMLEKYIQSGIVTYIYWQGRCQQIPVYNHAVSHFQYKTKWLAIIDGDEYIVPVKEGTLIPQVLDEIDKNYPNPTYVDEGFYIGGVSVQWRVYGTCGHQTRCPGLLFENYRYRADDNYIGSHLTKTICNPRLVTDISNPHYVHYIKDYFTVSENGSVVPHAFFFDASYGKLRINHYQSKSCEELIEKNHRGWPDGTPQLDEDFLYRFSVQCSKVYDPIMNRYIDELKKRISSN